MTGERLLLSHPAYRDLWVSWQVGRLTGPEAVFLARRVEFHLWIEFLPPQVVGVFLGIYDFLYEP